MKEFAWYCPECSQEKLPDNMVLDRRYSCRALRLPYFMCGGCRLIYVDRVLIREIISNWKYETEELKTIPLKKLYKETLAKLEGVIEYYCKNVGYKRARFVKKPK